MNRTWAAAAAGLAIVFAAGCSEEDTGTGPGTNASSDLVETNGLVWAVGTMGGLKAFDMEGDSLKKSVNLGYDIYDHVAASGRFAWIFGGMMGTVVKRVEATSDTTDTIITASSSVSGTIGRARGMESGGGRIWAIGSATKALFGVDTGANVMDVQVNFPGLPDSGGCIALAPFGPTMYVLSANPISLHAVDMATASQTWSLRLDSGTDASSRASLGVSSEGVFVYLSSQRELLRIGLSSAAILSRITVAGGAGLNETMTASSAGVFVTKRDSSMHSVLKISPENGAVLAQYDFRDGGVESVTALQAFGQRLFAVIINSDFGQNAVIEFNTTTLIPLARIENVYVSDVSVRR